MNLTSAHPACYRLMGVSLGPQASAFRPLQDRLLVRPMREKTVHNGILAPEVAQRPGALGDDKFLRLGLVVAAGPGDNTFQKSNGELREIPRQMKVRVGDLVKYDHPSEREITLDGDPYVMLREGQHVLGILTCPSCGDSQCQHVDDETCKLDREYRAAMLAWDAPGYFHGHPDYEG